MVTSYIQIQIETDDINTAQALQSAFNSNFIVDDKHSTLQKEQLSKITEKEEYEKRTVDQVRSGPLKESKKEYRISFSVFLKDTSVLEKYKLLFKDQLTNVEKQHILYAYFAVVENCYHDEKVHRPCVPKVIYEWRA